MKNKDASKRYICRECGYISHKWLGKCPGCQTWDSFDSEIISARAEEAAEAASLSPAIKLIDVKTDSKTRFKTGMGELDRILGGGMVEGALILIGGEPGIGKSTLMLQLCRHLASGGKKVLYISGEESLSQIKLRAVRLNTTPENLYAAAQTDVDAVLALVNDTHPDFLIIDSIQTMAKSDIPSLPGSTTQVREATAVFMSLAKSSGIPVIIVGHVTKEGSIAGPKILEHMVDTVLYFEGSEDHTFRLLRSVKNRFGPANEVAIFEMKDSGLKEILNPSELFVSRQSTGIPGSVITAAVNGTMPVLVELQALVSRVAYEGRPKCIVSGLDFNRVSLLSAVLQNRLGVDLFGKDIYASITGGLRITEPAADLSIVLSLYTAVRNIIMPQNTCVFGEVGLAGELRGVTFAEKRITEAARIGFGKILIPYSNRDAAAAIDNIEVVAVKNLREAAEWVSSIGQKL